MLINYKRSGVHNAHGTRLLPGVNSVPSEQWAKSRIHPMVQYDLEEGVIVEEQDFVESALLTPNEESLAEDVALQTLKIPQAKALVEETVHLGLLNRWKTLEKRNQVLGAIKRQIEKLESPAEERDRDAARQITTGEGAVEISIPNPGDRE